MCGIFGYVSASNHSGRIDDIKTIKKLYTLSESRGKEASGVISLTQNKIEFIRNPIPASELIRRKDFNSLLDHSLTESGLVAVFGHSRLVTNGLSENNKNNQPVYSGKILGVHNGIIVNDVELWKKNKQLIKNTDVDTEVLLQLINLNLKKDGILKSIAQAYNQIEGVANIALIFEDLDLGVLATNNGSLYYALSVDGKSFLFASEKFILAQAILMSRIKSKFLIKNIFQLESNNILLIDFSKFSIQTYSFRESVSSNLKISNYHRKIIEYSKIAHGDSSIKSNLKFKPIDRSIIEKAYRRNYKTVSKLKRCSRCILPETMPFIEFDNFGVCNYCKDYIIHKPKGVIALKKLFDADHELYDCIVTLSGGRDSSFGMHFMKDRLGLDIASYTYDWGMVTDLARRNQMRMCGVLGVEHILVSADIIKKRKNIRKNVSAWLKKPELGMIPLFMAGDKKFFYWSHKIAKQLRTSKILLCENLLERTNFKTGFCGIKPVAVTKNTYTLSLKNKLKLLFYYFKNFIKNPRYINTSLLDTFGAFTSYYVMKHNFINLFDYIKWDEYVIDQTLAKNYNWEKSHDAKSTWRIGDGTAAFYNYIYYTMAGITENDTFRSNQVREGIISRKQALSLSAQENKPRIDSIAWYLDAIGLDFNSTMLTINNAKKIY